MRPSGHSHSWGTSFTEVGEKQKPQPHQRAMGHNDSILAEVLIKKAINGGNKLHHIITFYYVMFALRFKCHVNLAPHRIGALMPLGSCRLAMWAGLLTRPHRAHAFPDNVM